MANPKKIAETIILLGSGAQGHVYKQITEDLDEKENNLQEKIVKFSNYLPMTEINALQTLKPTCDVYYTCLSKAIQKINLNLELVPVFVPPSILLLNNRQEYRIETHLIPKSVDAFYYISNAINFSQKELYELSKILILGLQDMHSKGIIHRDIKPENILILNFEPDNLNNENISARYIDFGLSENIREPHFDPCRTTHSIILPEFIDECYIRRVQPPIDPSLAFYYGQKTDVWSLGITILSLIDTEFYFILNRELQRGNTYMWKNVIYSIKTNIYNNIYRVYNQEEKTEIGGETSNNNNYEKVKKLVDFVYRYMLGFIRTDFYNIDEIRMNDELTSKFMLLYDNET